MNIATKSTPGAVDFDAVKAKQQMAWASGNYATIGTTLQIVGEDLCETMDLRSGAKVLDVAAGNGNATLAAARRFCHVTSSDYVEHLLEKGRVRAEAEGHTITYQQADAEDLPYEDGTFDAVVSTFGVMFTPNQQQAASELLRVCRSDGKIGLANWTPDGFIGHLFKTLGGHIPPAPGLRSPALWGTENALHEMFDAQATSIGVTFKTFVFRYLSPDHFIDVFRTYYGPVHKAFQALGDGSPALEADMKALIERFNTATDGTMVVPSEYAEVVIRKA